MTNHPATSDDSFDRALTARLLALQRDVHAQSQAHPDDVRRTSILSSLAQLLDQPIRAARRLEAGPAGEASPEQH